TAGKAPARYSSRGLPHSHAPPGMSGIPYASRIVALDLGRCGRTFRPARHFRPCPAVLPFLARCTARFPSTQEIPMEIDGWSQTLGAAPLLAIAGGAIALILVLVIRFK